MKVEGRVEPEAAKWVGSNFLPRQHYSAKDATLSRDHEPVSTSGTTLPIFNTTRWAGMALCAAQ
jgi:hypothetical protein